MSGPDPNCGNCQGQGWTVVTVPRCCGRAEWECGGRGCTGPEPDQEQEQCPCEAPATGLAAFLADVEASDGPLSTDRRAAIVEAWAMGDAAGHMAARVRHVYEEAMTDALTGGGLIDANSVRG